MKLSIGIPAYNVEKYIVPCLTSVVKQDLSFSDYEIIVVNDGSTDTTLEKVIEFAKDYPNFVIISKENEGPGMARNACIEKAQGEYIWFIDSDDTIKENCFGSLCKQMKDDNLDILEFDFICLDEQGKEVIPRIYTEANYQRPIDIIMSGRENLLYSEKFIPMLPIHIYRTKLLRDNNLYLIHGRHEDENYAPRVHYYAKRVKCIDTVIYYYLQRNNSIMGSYSSKNYFDTITSMGLLKKFVTEEVEPNDIEIKNYLNRRIERALMMIYIRSILEGYNMQKELIREMKKHNLYPFELTIYKKYKVVYDFSTSLFIPYFRRKLKRMGVIKK